MGSLLFHFVNVNLKCVNLTVGFPLFTTRTLNVSTKGIRCAKNRNKCVNKGKQARKSSKRRETVPLQCL